MPKQKPSWIPVGALQNSLLMVSLFMYFNRIETVKDLLRGY